MQPYSNVVRASILRGFGPFLEQRGVPAEPLLHTEGLSLSAIVDSDRDLPFNSVARIMEHAAAACNDDNFGLALAKAYPIGGMGLFSFLFLNSTTVEDALQTVVRYIPLIRIPFKFTFDRDAHGGCIGWRPADDVPRNFRQIYIFGASLLMLRLRQLCPADWQPMAVQLQQCPPKDAAELHRLFGPNIVFNAERNAIFADNATLSMPVPQAAPELRVLLERYGEREMAGLLPRDEKLVESTRAAVLQLMGERRVSLEDVAATLDCSPRSLQTRLAAMSKTFEEIVNEARKNRAEQLMQEPNLSLTQIAHQLGFSELSAFTRAAQRWFGRTPTAQRQLLNLKLH